MAEENGIQSQAALLCRDLYKGWKQPAIYANTDEMLGATILDETQWAQIPGAENRHCSCLCEELDVWMWCIFIEHKKLSRPRADLHEQKGVMLKEMLINIHVQELK